jgi:ppGpp synthetase/RelA/SpoT-type nucleotidyltranferase
MVKGRKSVEMDDEGTISDVLKAIEELKGRFDKLEKDTKEILEGMKEFESLKARVKEIEVVIDKFKRFEIENKK